LYESRISDLNVKYNQAVTDRKKISDDFKDLQKECAELQKQVEELHERLEMETLEKVDLQNNLQNLQKDWLLKEEVYNQQLTETRTRRQKDVSEIDGRLTEQYNTKLQESLQELRDEYEAQMRGHREEIKLLYENKVHVFLI
jgi:lamin B